MLSSIAAGQSVIFLESNASGTNVRAGINAGFKSSWFGGNVPAGLVVGNYGGSGIGLSTSGDAVNVFNSGRGLVANISFGASTTGKSFDNSAGLNNTDHAVKRSEGKRRIHCIQWRRK